MSKSHILQTSSGKQKHRGLRTIPQGRTPQTCIPLQGQNHGLGSPRRTLDTAVPEHRSVSCAKHTGNTRLPECKRNLVKDHQLRWQNIKTKRGNTNPLVLLLKTRAVTAKLEPSMPGCLSFPHLCHSHWDIIALLPLRNDALILM